MAVNVRDRIAQLPLEEQKAIEARTEEMYAEEMIRRLHKRGAVTTKRQVALPPLTPGVTPLSRRPSEAKGVRREVPSRARSADRQEDPEVIQRKRDSRLAPRSSEKEDHSKEFQTPVLL